MKSGYKEGVKVIDFVKDKTNPAIFNGFRCNTLYYRVRKAGTEDTYEFSIPVEDLGNATLNKFESALTLMRYIRRAIEANELIKVQDE